MKRRGVLFAALLTGLVVRIAALPLPGTEDVGTWKIWAFGASRNVTQVYGVGGDPPVRGVVKWQALETTVDYPPAALYELGLVGLAYRRIDPAFADAPALTVAIKLPGLVCGIALTALLAWAAKRFTSHDDAASWVALAYWLNPATILNGEVLGYLDPLMMLPGIAALVLIHLGAMESAGLALALAVLTKPQGVFLVAACALAAWHTGAARALGRVAAGGTLGATLLLLPFALTGALPNMWLAFGSFYARRDILSGNAANVWWIVNYAVRAYYQVPRLGFRTRSSSRSAASWRSALSGRPGSPIRDHSPAQPSLRRAPGASGSCERRRISPPTRSRRRSSCTHSSCSASASTSIT